MNLETLARLGEFVGGFFVVVSIVYLAHQVRQNTKSLRAENYARVLNRLATVQSNLSVHAELNRIVIVGAQTPEALSRADRVRFGWALYELLGAAEFVYHQAQERAVADEVWERWKSTLAWWMSNPGMRLWWRSRPSPFSQRFERLVDELIRDTPIDHEAVERWRRFVAGDDPAEHSE